MNTHEILKAARKLIETQASWTVGAFARDCGGDNCYIYGSSAVCWCAEGAILKCKATDGYADAMVALRRVVGVDIAVFNDALDRTHAEVLAAFDEAIQATA